MTDIVAPPAAPPAWAQGCVNLASPRMGSEAVLCSDDSFAAMARMLADGPALFKPDVYDDFGKWMDGWESKRRRDGGHDWCVVKLGGPGRVAGFDVDTSHFTGNYPPACAVFGSAAKRRPAADGAWTRLTPDASLGPSAHHFVEAADPGPWRWLKLEIYPDGGVARLRVFGTPEPDWDAAEGADGLVELSALANGGRVLAYNDAHYGDVQALLSPGRAATMGDGWETRRRREPGADWILVRLGAAGVVERVEVDTGRFKGNFPESCSVQAARVAWGSEESVTTQAMFWPDLVARRPLGPDAIHTIDGDAVRALGTVDHVKLTIHPDGGVSRLRVFGRRA